MFLIVVVVVIDRAAPTTEPVEAARAPNIGIVLPVSMCVDVGGGGGPFDRTLLPLVVCVRCGVLARLRCAFCRARAYVVEPSSLFSYRRHPLLRLSFELKGFKHF